MNFQEKILIPKNTVLYNTLDRLAEKAKVVCFCGLPGVGKSLYVQQFTLMAMSREREVTTLQWDLARQHFETCEVLEKFPEINGITHAGIRKACGWWSRKAVNDWYKRHNKDNAILIAESPLIGNRLVELATDADDDAERFLSSEAVQFVVPIPSVEVRKVIVSKREDTSKNPNHVQEKADALPHVVMSLYKELCFAAERLGRKITQHDLHSYQPELYEFVYRHVLRKRHFLPLYINTVIRPGGKHSVYDFGKGNHLSPRPEDVTHFVNNIGQRFPGEKELNFSVENWFTG